MVPAYATAPVLVVVGALMFRSVARVDFSHIEDAVPAFLTIALIPLTFSITQGILWGFVSHAALYALCGRRREISAGTWLTAALSAGLIVLDHVRW
jgi:AGZA family xanthine/uracil permease-like MFS transporter